MTRHSENNIYISVIIPLYNKEEFIRSTIQSVLQQSNPNFELIVVDDGSTDNSVSVVRTYHDERLRLLSKKNEGVCSARNTGISKAHYDWLFFLDADDNIVEDALETFVKMIRQYPNEKIFTANSLYLEPIKRNNVKIKKSVSPFWGTWTNSFSLGPGHSLIHKSLIEQYGFYDIRMSFFEDWEFSLRLSKYGSIVYCNKYVMRYNQQPTGLSGIKHSINREMAYYIPEILAKGDTTFWERALLYENIEHEIAVWEGNEENIRFYRDMQRKHFAWYHKYLHWLRQQLKRHGIL